MNVLVERVRSYRFNHCSVRVWTEQILPALVDVEAMMPGPLYTGDLAVHARSMLYTFDANAVEVLDKTGEGVVLYADWP
jgi:hypothetical protein